MKESKKNLNFSLFLIFIIILVMLFAFYPRKTFELENILEVSYPINLSYEYSLDNTSIDTLSTEFENGDEYYMNRITFNQSNENNFEISIPLEGDNIIIRYIDYEAKQWVTINNDNGFDDLPKTTLFIDTDTNSYIFSVAGVYENNFTNNTLTILKDKELSSNITKNDNTYNFNILFPQENDIVCEYWYMSSSENLMNWSDEDSLNRLIVHDLSINRRWSYYGYYFPTPHNYNPGGVNVIYRIPANYTGAYLVKKGDYNFGYNFGYISTEICRKNQNETGYWETGPQSEWLFTDFNIGSGFYDTRFNTDFAINLLYAYKRYDKEEFLESLITYINYFIKFADGNSYITQNDGILVADYGQGIILEDTYEKTHVSLNHHVAEMNLLYELYELTLVEEYLNLANKMLQGIEDTRDEWILDNGNLRYELYYTKDTNLMVDYPYLTYNDLYDTNTILKRLFNQENDTINYLMQSKLAWMIENDITGYSGY